MKLILCLSLILVTSTAFAINVQVLRIEPNKEYMSFFLKGYLKWFEETFNPPHLFMNTAEEKSFLLVAISAIEHFKIADFPELDQLLIGQTVVNGKHFYRYRIHLAKSLSKHPWLLKFNIPVEPRFVEWDDSGKLCFLGQVENPPWENIPKSPGAFYFEHHCQVNMKSALRLEAVTVVSKQKASWKNSLSPYSASENKTYTSVGLSEVFYSFTISSSLMVRPGHHHFIYSHLDAAFLSFDKASVDAQNNITIFYP